MLNTKSASDTSLHILVTALELSRKLSISRSTVYRMVAAGIIPSIRVGSRLGGRRFDEADVREALERRLPSLGRETTESETNGCT